MSGILLDLIIQLSTASASCVLSTTEVQIFPTKYEREVIEGEEASEPENDLWTNDQHFNYIYNLDAEE